MGFDGYSSSPSKINHNSVGTPDISSQNFMMSI